MPNNETAEKNCWTLKIFEKKYFGICLVSIVCNLWDGRPKNQGSVEYGTTALSSAYPDSLWGLPSILPEGYH